MQTPSPHSQFFSSLKQLEKRLKLDNPPSHQESVKTTPQTQSSFISSPLYLINSNNDTSNDDSISASETPLQFLSNSPLAQETPCQVTVDKVEAEKGDDGVDEIELLMQLLGLSDNRVEVDLGCDDAFYGNIVGVKGPKSRKEVDRLEGWIQHFQYTSNVSGAEGRSESFRVAHLLLGKAALIHSDVGSVEFPSTIDEFLLNDPPLDEVASTGLSDK